MKSKHILFISFLCITSFNLISSSCAALKPYQPTQIQGGKIDQTKIDQIKIGFTKNQVAYLIGQPAMTNTLLPNTWQYLYTKKTQEKLNIEQNLILTFDENGALEKIEK